MKTIAAIAAALSLTAGVACAAEGNGDPFPFRAPPITTTVTGVTLNALKFQDPFGYVPKARAITMNEVALVPQTGSAQSVETPNGLPAGFSDSPTQLASEQRSMTAAVSVPSGTHG